MTHPDTKPEALDTQQLREIASAVNYSNAECMAASRALHEAADTIESLRTKLQEQALQSLSTMGQDDATIADLRAQLAEARAEAEALRADAKRWRKLSSAMASSDPVEVAAPMPTALEAFMRIQAENKARADALIAQGKCPDCEGDGQMGGQFCGGYWTCETCNGTGTAMGAKEA